ncbi:transposon Tf2-1 polyprotein [Trifolium medium]|nr:transposon Tf2-1 polyprotein [Trifolium medium]
MVGNGEFLRCTGLCNEIPITVNKHTFSLSFYVLPIQGADVVLGVQWLQTLGPFVSDFTIPSMQFYHHNSLLTITGSKTSSVTPASYNQINRMIHTDSIATFHSITIIPSPDNPNHPSNPDTQTIQSLHPDLQAVLHPYTHIFNPPQGLPPTRPHDHHIHLNPTASPVNIKPYRYPHYQKEAMTTIILDMLKEGLIQPSNSPYSSPVLLVKKKDGSWRFCVDYRALNAITIKDRFPIPTIDELIDELHGSAIFTKIDLRSGYHQIRLAPEDTPKTGFRTMDGHYEFLVMPFGLTNAPSTFQAAMNDLLRPFLRKFALVFFDDILIYSPDWQTHLVHLQQVLQSLAHNQFYAKLSKCQFGVSSVEYLGHIISIEGVRADPSKIQTMVDWPTPKNITALRAFLGLTGFYRRFVLNYATIASPLTALLKTNAFIWSEVADSAFLALKSAMTNLPLLTLPDFSLPFEVTTDASLHTVGAVLSQKSKPLAFFSKKLSPRLSASSTYIRELYALTEAIKKWRQYLLGSTFKIFTDHKSLKSLMTQTIQTPEQQKWLTKLLGYTYEIHYKPGKENVVADALSRIEESPIEGECVLLTFPTSSFINQLQLFFATNTAGIQLMQKALNDPKMQQKFQIKGGLLYFKNRLFIPMEAELTKSLLQEFHSSPAGGHSGIQATLARLSTNFYWPGMHKDVKDFVNACSICQHNKYSTQPPYGLLQPLPLPQQVWEDISMDFITHLPLTHNRSCIWVIVDRLTKFAHFIALPTSFTAASLAPIFITEIYRLHGAPKTIVSDRDRVFVSQFWRALFHHLGTSLAFSSSYHPQSDGQTEVLNRCLETYLRCFVSDEPQLWLRFLALAEFWYNTSFHSAIGMSPFEALYGRKPPNLVHYTPGTSKINNLDDLLTQKTHILKVLKENLTKAQNRMVTQANRHRQDHNFEVGQWVYLKLQPYRQHSVHQRHSHKLAKRFYGPFRILKKIGKVAYELELPAASRVHPVFHVSLLKLCIGEPTTQITPLEDPTNYPPIVPIPVAIINRRIAADGNEEFLIEWKDLPSSEATWMDKKAFLEQFPSINLEDKILFDGVGNDTQQNGGLNSNAGIGRNKPKRNIRKPKRYDD